MTKEQTKAMQGIAILMMVIYHLFYVEVNHGNGVVFSLFLNGVPVLERLSEIAYPVSLFVMITGYGLACSYCKGTSSSAEGIGQRLKRLAGGGIS